MISLDEYDDYGLEGILLSFGIDLYINVPYIENAFELFLIVFSEGLYPPPVLAVAGLQEDLLNYPIENIDSFP